MLTGFHIAEVERGAIADGLNVGGWRERAACGARFISPTMSGLNFCTQRLHFDAMLADQPNR